MVFNVDKNSAFLETCQKYCNVLYPGDCKMFLYESEEKKCGLYKHTIDYHMR